jgi:hypothetical protein
VSDTGRLVTGAAASFVFWFGSWMANPEVAATPSTALSFDSALRNDVLDDWAMTTPIWG